METSLSISGASNKKGDSSQWTQAGHQRHSAEMLNNLNEMRLKNEFCDARLVTDSTSFEVHKIVLAACSPYFKALFKYESSVGNASTARSDAEHVGASSDITIPGSPPTFDIKDVSPTVMEQILTFIYTGGVTLTTENVEEIMIAANMLQLLELKHICGMFLTEQLDTDNCFGLRAFADVYSCGNLKKEADILISKRFYHVSQTDEFLTQDFDTIKSLLERSDLKVKSEQQIFEAFIKWVKHDVSSRLSCAHELMNVIRIKLLSPDYIKKKMSEENFLWKDKELSLILLSYVAGMHAPEGANLLNESQEVRSLPETIYAIGGRDANRCLGTAEKLNFEDNRWDVLPDMLQVRTAVGVVSLNGLLYAMGGECEGSKSYEPTQYLDTMECYDPKTNLWTVRSSMSQPRSFAAVAVLKGLVYVMGGESHPACHTSAEVYDPIEDKWSPVTDMNTPRSGAGAAVLDGMIYIAGGHDRQTHHSSMECYNPDTQQWKPCANMNYSCSGIALHSVGHGLFAFGGRNRFAQAYYNKIQRYSPSENRWEDIATLHHPRAWPAAAVYNGEVYIIGGYDGNQRLRTVEKFNPITLKCVKMPSMNDYRAGVGAATL
jgi:N-acetylneuraminic acid mutarotase